MRPKYVKWSRDDIKKLERLYSVTSNAELEREFAPRSLSSIMSCASNLNLRRRRDWKAIATAHTPVILGVRRKVDA